MALKLSKSRIGASKRIKVSKVPTPKYRTKFFGAASVIIPQETDKWLAKASLASLAQFLPAGIDPDSDPDLLYIGGNLCVASLANKNGDCITNAQAVREYRKFEKRLVDIDHSRGRICGFILKSYLSEFATNNPLSDDDALASKNPVNIGIIAVVWRVANDGLSDFLIQCADPHSKDYQRVSFSFEVGFTDYIIVQGNVQNRNCMEGKIIPPESPQYSKYDKALKCNGGPGEIDGNIVYRILDGDLTPLGAGITANPAGDVKGIEVFEDKPLAQKPEEQSKQKNDNALVFSNKNDTKCGFTEIKMSVMNDKPMKIEKLEDISSNAKELFKDESYASQVSKLIADKTAEISEKYVADLKAKEESAAKVEATKREMEKKMADMAKEIEDHKAELAKIKDETSKKEAQEKFHNRMAAMDDEYDLSDEDRACIADDIEDMADDEYGNYARKAKVLLKEKSKKYKEEKARKEKEEEVKRNEKHEGKREEKKDETEAREILASVTEDKSQTPLPNGAPPRFDLKERWAQAFRGGDSITFNGKKIKKKEYETV